MLNYIIKTEFVTNFHDKFVCMALFCALVLFNTILDILNYVKLDELTNVQYKIWYLWGFA